MLKKIKDNDGKGAVWVIILIVVLVIIALVVWYILTHFGLGFGNGNGNGDGEGDGTAVVSQEQSEDGTNENEVTIESTVESTEESQDEGDTNTVIVKIVEDKVTVNDKAIANADELKSYIEEINKDGLVYELHEENSILETHEWVTKVFDELKINLISVES